MQLIENLSTFTVYNPIKIADDKRTTTEKGKKLMALYANQGGNQGGTISTKSNYLVGPGV